MGQGLGHGIETAAHRRLGQRPVDDVALGVAAAEAVDDEARRVEPFDCGFVVAVPERRETFDQRKPDVPRPGRRLVGGGVIAAVGGKNALDLVFPTGTQVGHHRMPVIERVEPAVGMLVPGLRDLDPTIADVMARQVNPPQQGRSVHQVERHGAAVLADRSVIEREHLVDLAEVEVIERTVPPVVHLEEVVVARPMGLARYHPADAVLRAPLHLHDMRDGVVGPTVERLQLDGLAAGFLGPIVVTGFFEAEGVHAQHDGIARHVGRPLRQSAGDAVAHVARIGPVEIHQVAGLQGDQIPRKQNVVAIQRQRRRCPVAVQQQLQGSGVGVLAVVERQRLGPGEAGLRRGRGPGFGGEPHEMGIQQMGHGKVGGRRDGAVQKVDGVAAVDVERFNGLIEHRHGLRRGAGEGVPLTIGQHRVAFLSIGSKQYKASMPCSFEISRRILRSHWLRQWTVLERY